MKKSILLIVIGIAMLIIGNASRTYSAFGGEDLGFIVLACLAVANLARERKEQMKKAPQR